MWGKFFASTFTGSMRGQGSKVFSVWGYVIAHAVKGQVEINPAIVAFVIGDITAGDVERCVEYLCAPDEKSRSRIVEGRRLVREGEFAYRVVNHDLYRGMRNEDDRREYNRTKQREYREQKRAEYGGPNASIPDVKPVYRGVPPSAHTEAETEGSIRSGIGSVQGIRSDVIQDVVAQPGVERVSANGSSSLPEPDAKKARKPKVLAANPAFEAFWALYPRRVGKLLARSSWEKHKPPLELVKAALAWQGKSEQWTKDGGQFIPHPATWLNQHRWEDEKPRKPGEYSDEAKAWLAKNAGRTDWEMP